jgi:hypothetical protein
LWILPRSQQLIIARKLVLLTILLGPTMLSTEPAPAVDWSVTPRNAAELTPAAFPNVSELSGVTYQGPAAGGLSRFMAIQDSGGGLTTFDVGFSNDGSLNALAPVSDLTLADSTLDFEGVAYTGSASNSVFAAYEGNTNPADTIPGVAEYSLVDGSRVSTVVLPAAWTTNGNAVSNYGFESLTLTGDGSKLWTANEEALTIDGPLASATNGTIVRLQELNRSGGAVTAGAQYAYEVDPWHAGGGRLQTAVGSLIWYHCPTVRYWLWNDRWRSPFHRSILGSTKSILRVLRMSAKVHLTGD